MRRVIIIAGFVMWGLASAGLSAQEPVFQLQDIQNNWLEYDDVKGEKLTVIDFWATWCQPCVRSIPELNKIAGEVKDLGVEFVGISIDGPRNQSKILPFVRSMGIDYTILKDINSEVMMEMNVTSVPTLLIIDKEGEVVYTHEGFRPGDEEVIREEINSFL